MSLIPFPAPSARAALVALGLGSTALVPLWALPGIAQAQSLARSIQIPAGPLGPALTSLGRQAGVQLSFAPTATAGRMTAGFSGMASVEAALAAVLAGTGLSYQIGPDNVIVVTAPLGEEIAAATGGLYLGSVVIYGDRSAATLEDSRASVAIVSGQPVDAPAVQTRTQSFARMANVQAGDWTTSGFVIRGVNSEGFVPGAAGAPLASFYLDGVQQTTEGTRLGQRGMFDVEQVEVYRGPQSTMSGRAALAGALYMRSVRPDFTRSGAVQVTVGTNGRRQIGVAFGNRLSESLAYRISAEYSEVQSDLDFSSYQHLARYDDFVTGDYSTVRGQILWQPFDNEGTEVLVTLSRSTDSPTSNDIAGPGWSSTAPGYDARRGDIWGAILPDYYRGLGLTELPAFQELREGEVFNFGVEITHDITDVLRFTSMTGLSRSVTDRGSINLGTPGAFLYTDGQFTYVTGSQEFRFNYDDGDLRWVAGLYASRLHNESWRESMLLSFDQSETAMDLENYALFGEIGYRFAPAWTIIAGGRFDWIRQSETSHYAVNGVATTTSTSSYADAVFLPSLALQYEVSPNHTISFGYQQGYRPGGSGVRSSDGFQFTYDQETAHNIEVTWRGRLLDDRLRIGASLFHQDWRNQQVEVVTDPTHPVPRSTSIIVNAGRSTSYGAELEMAWAVNDSLDLVGSLGLLHTRFDDFALGTWGIDYSGLPFPNAPERTLSLGFRWQGGSGWHAAGAINHASSSMSRLEQGVPVPMTLDGYTTVDAEIGYTFRDGPTLTAYATNLFDTEYFTYEAGPGVLATLGARREMGLRLDYRF
ncbi:TonB-dependent receptor [Pararhodobacter aggregans]|uniref:Secretin/TonB short N-terminal domain-containing protein n=1 Tax=Pararhodobacter aggregans TaxID=404875 RepID=A0A2T7UM36_9RHOB|nr:TonB-dependent receptor [Pararhodobacter aggregans]PTW99978.1 outer membrane receptor protein involved in Fe transport [Pararhodobacter aggregans]PVE45734.1 hypothetical protein DDE23_19710 [Pararhodobacter aggregans]